MKTIYDGSAYANEIEEILIKIKERRISKNFKQEHMARALKITQNNYSKLESGLVPLTIEKFFKIAELLGVDVRFFLSYKTNQPL